MRVLDREDGTIIIDHADGFGQVLDRLLPSSDVAESIIDDYADYLKESASWESIARDLLLCEGRSYLEDYIQATDQAVGSLGSIECADGSLIFEALEEVDE